MTLLECGRCKTVKPSSAFNANKHTDTQFDHYCRPCRSKYMKIWNEKHGKQHYKSKYKKQWSAIISDLFGQVCCQECGYGLKDGEETALLEWHHREDHKTGAPSRIFSSKPTRERIYEILTCTPLCPTCHRLYHLKGR